MFFIIFVYFYFFFFQNYKRLKVDIWNSFSCFAFDSYIKIKCTLRSGSNSVIWVSEYSYGSTKKTLPPFGGLRMILIIAHDVHAFIISTT